MFNNKKTINNGILPKTGERYSVTLLSRDKIDQMLRLQNDVLDALPEDQKNFLVKRDRTYIEDHLKAGNAVIGIHVKGQLIAQSFIVNPTAASTKKCGLEDMQLDTPLNKVSLIQGVSVHPTFLGNKLMGVMLDEWEKLALKDGRTKAVAKVKVDNQCSLEAFMRAGFDIHNTGLSPADGNVVYNLLKPIKADEGLTTANNNVFVRAALARG